MTSGTLIKIKIGSKKNQLCAFYFDI